MRTSTEQWIVRLHETRTRHKITRLFNIPRTRTLSRGSRKKAAEINALFDAVHTRCGLSERAIFERAYEFRPSCVDRHFWDFVRNVLECPEEVLRCAESLLQEVHKNDMYTP